jgi:NodT family efflux transporter outer membrane factor (OMF) lipoprotein
MARFTKISPGGTRLGVLAATAMAAALFASACASLPSQTIPATTRNPASLASAQTLAATSTPWPGSTWWTAYNDPQLNALIEEGLANSPTLAQAQDRLRAAEAARRAADAAQGPNLSLDAAAREQKLSYHDGIPPAFVPQGYQDYGHAALDFSYEFDFWGRNRAAVAAAASDARAAQADAAEARLMLSTSIASAYADLARLNAERAIAVQSLEVRTQTVSLVTRRVNAGVDTRGELREAEAGPPAAREQIAALDEAIAQTRNRLAALVGAGPDRGLAIAAPSPQTPAGFGLPANLSADLIGRRPDLVAARWRAEAATRRVDQAHAAFYPNVNLIANLGLESLGLSNLTRSGSDIGQAGPALSLPIFDSGRLQASLLRADAERDAAIDGYNATLTEALHEVADVVVSQRFLTTRTAEARTALAADEDAYRITTQRYQGGLANYQSVLIAEDAVLARRLAVADLESRKFSLDVALVRALGGGFSAQAQGE